MGQDVRNDSRFCQIPQGLVMKKYDYQKPWPAIIAGGIIVILSISPVLFWAPALGVPEKDTLVYTLKAQGWTDLGSKVHGYSLEPVASDLIASNCYDTLITYDRERTDGFRPLLVTEVPSLENGRISPDGLTYRLTIRSDSPLTSEDVEYSIKRAMIRGRGGMLQEALLGIDSIATTTYNNTGYHYTAIIDFEEIDNAVETEGDDVVFHLEKVYPQFLHALASSENSIVNKAWCVWHGDWSGTDENWEDYIGIHSPSPLDYAIQGFGPFMLESVTIADFWPWHIAELVLVRNDNYWRGPARLKRIVIKFIDDWETRKQMFLEGDADICYVPQENYKELEGVEGLRIYSGLPTLSYRGLYFNFAALNNSPYIGSGEFDGNGVPPDFFSDIDIRKAFAYSIDYDTIINEIYAGDAQQLASPVIEGHPFLNPEQECYTYDLDMAQHHFQQAWGGEVWTKGFNLSLVFVGLGLDGNLWCPDKLAIGELIKSNVESINTNFHVTVEPLCYDWYVRPLFFWFDSPWPQPYSILWIRGDLFHGYNDSTIESLIEAGMNTVDPEERRTIYYQLQQLYHEFVPGIPLAQLRTRHYQRDWVWGWYYNQAAAGMDFYEMLKGTCQDATRNIIAHVGNLVDSEVMGAYAGSSLTETLDSVIAFMDNKTLTEASQLLNDFIDQVNALDLPVWDRGELTALAQEIIEVLTSSLTPTGGGFEMTMIPVIGGGVAATIVIVLITLKGRKIE